MGWSGGTLHRLDLTESYSSPVDETENASTYRRWLSSLESPEPGLTNARMAKSEAHVAAWSESGELWLYERSRIRRSLAEGRRIGREKGEGHIAGAGDTIAVATPGQVSVYRDLAHSAGRERFRDPALDAPEDLAVLPDGTPFVLAGDEVLEISEGGFRYPTPGATSLAVVRPGPTAHVVAWGSDVAYLLTDGAARRWIPPTPLRGLGVGDIFQEVVTVSPGADDVLTGRGWLITDHLDAIPDASIGVALAAFAESPKDSQLQSVGAAGEALERIGGCPIPRPNDTPPDAWTICCAQYARGQRLGENLDFLTARGAATVLGINPTVLAQSDFCINHPHEAVRELGRRLPDELAEAAEQPQSEALSWALLLHSAPYQESSWWVRCPGDWETIRHPACWDLTPSQEDQEAWYRRLVDSATLEPFDGPVLDYALLGGGYSGAHMLRESWPALFPSLVPSDLYFGSSAMSPRIEARAAKELTPDDATLRSRPLEIGVPVGTWFAPTQATGTYWPGQTIALTRLRSIARSGLLVRDFESLVDSMPKDDPAWPGDERPNVITEADIAIAAHYIATRVLADRRIEDDRWTYIHLQDLSALPPNSLASGWADCNGDCEAGDTAIDRLVQRIDAWSGLSWQSTP